MHGLAHVPDLLAVQDTDDFCRETLCNQEVAAYIDATFVAWAGSIHHSDAFRVSPQCRFVYPDQLARQMCTQPACPLLPNALSQPDSDTMC